MSGTPARSGLDALTLDGVQQTAMDCTLCALAGSRTQVIFGEGDPEARIMFVLEAPGYHDDRIGHPLAGPAGEAFNSYLTAAGLHRSDVYITTLVKCRPPANRTPYREEVEQCEGYLFKQVSVVQPTVICAVGNLPARILTGRNIAVRGDHGVPIPCTIRGREVQVVPMLHPAVASYAPEIAALLSADFASLPGLLGREVTPTTPSVSTPTTPSVATEPSSAGPPLNDGSRSGQHGGADQLSLEIG